VGITHFFSAYRKIEWAFATMVKSGVNIRLSLTKVKI